MLLDYFPLQVYNNQTVTGKTMVYNTDSESTCSDQRKFFAIGIIFLSPWFASDIVRIIYEQETICNFKSPQKISHDYDIL